jgi:hypothetical protein
MFELPFENVDELGISLSELGAVALRTPFLLLSDPFAVRVRREISQRCTSVSATKVNGLLY